MTASSPDPQPTSNESPDALAAQVQAITWHHPIDLGNGIVTPGHSSRTVPVEALPDLEGKSVLDIGAWDGLYSFDAESRGASRVVALDHYVWGVDMWSRDRYWEQCAAEGVVPDPALDETKFWNPQLPGQAGFNLAHRVLGSKVEAVVTDFMQADLDELGVFDVVYYFGVLYHMREPFTALQRVRSVTREVAVIETEAVVLGDRTEEPLLLFYAGSELGSDHTNWYVPNLAALQAMCRAAGFSRIEVHRGPPPPAAADPSSWRARLARRLRPTERQHYRLVIRAYV